MHIGIAGPIHIPSLNIKFKGDRSFWPIGMGGTPVNHLINALLERGYKVSAFSSSPEIDIESSFEWHEENLSIYVGPHRIRPRYVCLDFFSVESEYIKNAILKANPDFVHAHWQYEWALGTLKSKIKSVITCHDSPLHVFKAQTDLYRFYRLIMSFWVLQRAENLTTVSDYCLKGLRIFTKKNIAVIPNFEPDCIFNINKEKRFLGETISIAMVNNGFTTLKNVSVGILAFLQFNKEFPNSELHLYGKSFGIGEDAFTWCNKLGLRINCIHFHGELDFEPLMHRLSTADIFLHTSKEESFGMVIVEAMAMGIPVIAGINSGGPVYILKEGGGLLIDVNSIEEVKCALLKLIDPYVYHCNSIKAFEISSTRFSKNNVVDQYLTLYKSIFY